MSANQRGPENDDTGASCLFAIDPTAIKIGKEIGKGAFSVVYAGEYNKKHVAVKCQPKDEQGNIPPFVLKEVQILQRLRHSNILEFIGAADSRRTRQILILSEHSNHGDLNQLLKNIRKGGVTHLGWTKMVQIALDIARGIAFMHSQQFIHRDIKSSNILLDDSFSAKLCDFGFATETSWWREPTTSTTVTRRKSYCGTDAFMAPEMFLDEDYNENVDVFSFGVVLMEILCCREANQDDFLMRLPQYKFQIRIEEFRAALPVSCPTALARLAEQCVSFEPSERPTADQVVLALEELLTQKMVMDSGSEPVVLRPYTPTPRMVMEEHEPQMEDDEDYGDEDEEEEDAQDDEEEVGSGCGVDAEQATVALSPPPRTTGVMLKRNRRGNRGWSEKLFILEKDQLHYTDLPTKQEKSKSTPIRRQSLSTPTVSSLILKECRIWKTMEMPELSFNILDGNWKIKRELRALTHEELEKWMRLINQAIDYANEKMIEGVNNDSHTSTNSSNRSSHGSHERGKRTKQNEERPPEVTEIDDLYQWLSIMGLQRYTATFKAKGFSSLDFVRETGIETDDLNFLGIKDTTARKTLIAAAKTLRGEDEE